MSLETFSQRYNFQFKVLFYDSIIVHKLQLLIITKK